MLESEVISFSWMVLEEEIKFRKDRKSQVNHTVIERLVTDSLSWIPLETIETTGCKKDSSFQHTEIILNYLKSSYAYHLVWYL